MNISYIMLYLDWFEKTEELTNEEKGRLIDALVAYAKGNDHKQFLKGNEKYLFGTFKAQIDRDEEAYA